MPFYRAVATLLTAFLITVSVFSGNALAAASLEYDPAKKQACQEDMAKQAETYGTSHPVACNWKEFGAVQTMVTLAGQFKYCNGSAKGLGSAGSNRQVLNQVCDAILEDKCRPQSNPSGSTVNKTMYDPFRGDYRRALDCAITSIGGNPASGAEKPSLATVGSGSTQAQSDPQAQKGDPAPDLKEIQANLATLCWACPTIGRVFGASMLYGEAMHKEVGKDLASFLGTVLVIWLLFQAGKLLMPFMPAQGMKGVGNNVMVRISFVMVMAIALTSSTSYKLYWDNIYYPVVDATIQLANGVMDIGSGAGSFWQKAEISYKPTLVKGLTGQQAKMKDDLEKMVHKMQFVFTWGLATGIFLLQHGSWISGVFLIFIYAFAPFTFAVKILDAVMRWTIMSVLSSVLMAAACFPATRKYAILGGKALMESGLNIVVLALIGVITAGMIEASLDEMAKFAKKNEGHYAVFLERQSGPVKPKPTTPKPNTTPQSGALPGYSDETRLPLPYVDRPQGASPGNVPPGAGSSCPWHYPTSKGCALTTPFGWVPSQSRYHAGLDLACAEGTPIVAARDGKVSFADWGGNAGRMVTIEHGGNVYTNYFHLSKIQTNVGQVVKAGQQIGLMGSTGRSTGSHLHFEVGMPQKIDPAPVLACAAGGVLFAAGLGGEYSESTTLTPPLDYRDLAYWILVAVGLICAWSFKNFGNFGSILLNTPGMSLDTGKFIYDMRKLSTRIAGFGAGAAAKLGFEKMGGAAAIDAAKQALGQAAGAAGQGMKDAAARTGESVAKNLNRDVLDMAANAAKSAKSATTAVSDVASSMTRAVDQGLGGLQKTLMHETIGAAGAGGWLGMIAMVGAGIAFGAVTAVKAGTEGAIKGIEMGLNGLIFVADKALQGVGKTVDFITEKVSTVVEVVRDKVGAGFAIVMGGAQQIFGVVSKPFVAAYNAVSTVAGNIANATTAVIARIPGGTAVMGATTWTAGKITGGVKSGAGYMAKGTVSNIAKTPVWAVQTAAGGVVSVVGGVAGGTVATALKFGGLDGVASDLFYGAKVGWDAVPDKKGATASTSDKGISGSTYNPGQGESGAASDDSYTPERLDNDYALIQVGDDAPVYTTPVKVGFVKKDTVERQSLAAKSEAAEKAEELREDRRIKAEVERKERLKRLSFRVEGKQLIMPDGAKNNKVGFKRKQPVAEETQQESAQEPVGAPK